MAHRTAHIGSDSSKAEQSENARRVDPVRLRLRAVRRAQRSSVRWAAEKGSEVSEFKFRFPRARYHLYIFILTFNMKM